MTFVSSKSPEHPSEIQNDYSCIITALGGPSASHFSPERSQGQDVLEKVKQGKSQPRYQYGSNCKQGDRNEYNEIIHNHNPFIPHR